MIYSMSSFDVIIIGSGISGLLMACRLQQERFAGSILVVEKRAKENIFEIADDVPYYFNRQTDIPGLYLQNSFIDMKIWDRGIVFRNATKEIARRYAIKIVGQECKTTIEHLIRKRLIFIPTVNEHKGRRSILLKSLFENIKKRVVFLFERKVKVINIVKKLILLNDGSMISFKHLINTIALPVFLQSIEPPITNSLELESKPFFIALIPCKSTSQYQAVYCPDLNIRFNRCALLDDCIFIESPNEFNLKSISNYELGFFESLKLNWIIEHKDILCKWIKPGRFVALNTKERENLVNNLKEKDVFLLGRYGTWTFKLTEDVWDDTLSIAQQIL